MWTSKATLYFFFFQAVFLQLAFSKQSISQSLDKIYISINVNEVSALKIFELIEDQTDFVFLYSPELKDINDRFSLNFNEVSLEKILEILANKGSLNFKVVNKNISVKRAIKHQAKEEPLIQIDKPISGIILDSETEELLVGATVRVKNGVEGAITNLDGFFEFNLPEDAQTLVFSFVGFASQEVAIINQSYFEIRLVPDLKSLDEIVVVGYGFQKKANLTGAVSSVSGDEINRRPITQASQALQGLAPGVFVNTNSGEPGNDQAEITIRGIGTLGNASPLVLVDGIEAPLNSVNPQNIESINVLKDAASASIYGTRAANGVILITTKQGEYDKPTEIIYDGYFGVSNPTVIPDLLWDNETYLALYREAATNAGLPVNFTDEDIARYATLPSTDWMEVIIKGNAPITNHNLSFRGGTSKVNYFFSSGYLFQEGYLIDETKYNRFSNRLNLNAKLNNKLTFGARISYFNEFGTLESKDGTRQGRGGNSIDGKGGIVWSGGYVNHPIAPVYDALGRYGSIEQALGIERNRPNPVGVADNEIPELTSDDLLGKLSIEYQPLKNLRFSGNIGVNYQNEIISTAKKEYVTYDPVTLEPWTNGNGTRNEGNLAFQDIDRTYNITTWLQSNYDLEIERNQLNFLVGYNHENQNSESQRITERDFATSDVVEIGQGEILETSQQNIQSRLASVFGRISYNYDQKYFFEANFRADGSSRFGANNRWATFPAFSGGWIISNEPFWPAGDFLSFVKFRGSWGIIGNQSTNRFPFVSQISLTSSYNGQGGGALTRLGNPDLRWEETETTNIGFELGLFDDHLNLEADYFFKSTSDILTELNNPLTTGISSSTTVNAASIENEGIEVIASYRNSFGNVQFEISGNATYVTNEVTAVNPDLSDEEDRIVVSSQSSNNVFIIRGHPMNVIFGHQQNGIFQEDDFNEDGTLVEGIPDHFFIGNPIPGGFRYTDQNGDGVINEDDQVVIGDRQPKWFYGANFSVSYKGFQLSALLQGIGKADAWIARSRGPFPFAGLRQFWVDNRWTPENPNNQHPSLWVDRSGYNGESVQRGGKVLDYWVEDRSYLRLKNIRIAYNIPAGLLDKTPLKNFQIYFDGQNLWTRTDLVDIDPERFASETQADNVLPQSRILLVGINATF